MSTYRATLVGLDVTVAFIAKLLDGREYRASTQVPLLDSRDEIESYLRPRIEQQEGSEIISLELIEVF